MNRAARICKPKPRSLYRLCDDMDRHSPLSSIYQEARAEIRRRVFARVCPILERLTMAERRGYGVNLILRKERVQ